MADIFGDSITLEMLQNVPVLRPGFNELSAAAPILVQMNPNKWERSIPKDLDQKRLTAIIQHIARNSKTEPQRHCNCLESQMTGAYKNYYPVIMVKLTGECPFEVEFEKNVVQQGKGTKKVTDIDEASLLEEKNVKPHKIGYYLQRLSSFDFKSQW